MLDLLRTRRWISFTALVVIVIVAFGFLSRWQWSRAMDKQAEHNAEVAAMSGARVDIAQADHAWQAVRATGEFDARSQVLVRKRPQNTMNGFWVMTPLTTTAGSTVWVNRGWLRAEGAATVTPEIPSPPAGTVSINGVLREWETAGTTSGLPERMISDPDPRVLPMAGLATGYLQLIEPQQPGLEIVELPDTDDSRNISYAIQWILFALVAIGGWFYVLRREAREDAGTRKNEVRA